MKTKKKNPREGIRNKNFVSNPFKDSFRARKTLKITIQQTLHLSIISSVCLMPDGRRKQGPQQGGKTP